MDKDVKNTILNMAETQLDEVLQMNGFKRRSNSLIYARKSKESTQKIEIMYFVPDGTKECGYYECKKCGYRFLSLQTMKKIACPDCESEIDYEIGPDESMENVIDTAELLEKIEGEEEVEKMDTLLSLAITGGDESWI